MGTVTDKGYVPSTRAEIKSRLITRFKDVLGVNMSVDESAPQLQFINFISDILEEIEYERMLDFWARDVYKAQGIQLDILGKEIGVYRILKVPTQYSVVLSSTSIGYVISANTVFNSVDGIPLMQTKNNITIDALEKTISCFSVEDSTDSVIGTQLQTAQYIPQIIDATVSVVVPGSAQEADESYRVRLIKRATEFNAIIRLQNYILSLNSVLDCKIENNTTLSTSPNGVPSGAIEVRVLGGNSAAIATAIMNYTLTPTYLDPTYGEAVTVQDPAGYNKTYNITRPIAKDINVTITYKLKPNMGLTASEIINIQNIVTTYIESNTINKTVYISDILNIIYDKYGTQIYITDCYFTVDSTRVDSLYTCDIRKFLNADTITVTLGE